MNLLTLLKPRSAAFAALNDLRKEIDGCGVKRQVAEAYVTQLKTSESEALRNFNEKPSLETISQLHQAKTKRQSWEASGLIGAINVEVEAARGTLRVSEKARKIYINCFEAIENGIREKLVAAEKTLKKAAEELDVEGGTISEPTYIRELRTDLEYVAEGRMYIQAMSGQPLTLHDTHRIDQVLNGQAVDFAGILFRTKPRSPDDFLRHLPSAAELEATRNSYQTTTIRIR